MRISAKVDYAVRAAIELAAAGGEPIKGEEIADAYRTAQRCADARRAQIGRIVRRRQCVVARLPSEDPEAGDEHDDEKQSGGESWLSDQPDRDRRADRLRGL